MNLFDGYARWSLYHSMDAPSLENWRRLADDTRKVSMGDDYSLRCIVDCVCNLFWGHIELGREGVRQDQLQVDFHHGLKV